MDHIATPNNRPMNEVGAISSSQSLDYCDGNESPSSPNRRIHETTITIGGTNTSHSTSSPDLTNLNHHHHLEHQDLNLRHPLELNLMVTSSAQVVNDTNTVVGDGKKQSLISSSSSASSIQTLEAEAPCPSNNISLVMTNTTATTTAPIGDQQQQQQQQQQEKQDYEVNKLYNFNSNSNNNNNNSIHHLDPYFGEITSLNSRRTSKKHSDGTIYGNFKASRSLSVMIGDTKEHSDHHHNLNHHQNHQCHHQQHQHHHQYQCHPSNQQQNASQNISSPFFSHISCLANPTRNFGGLIHPKQTSFGLYHSLMEERIIHCQLSIAHNKDFAEEVRALIDVKKFVSDSFILMNVTKTQVSEIIDYILEKLVKCKCLSDDVYHEARSLIYVEPKDQLLASTMQGIYKSRIDGRFAYDNSWILSTCNLSTLNRRQVAIARLPYPVNFGRYSQEVRFVIVILVPSKEKLTKSAWETGRTFATMFTDLNFRRSLLRAKNQEEFKIELLTRAENLAKLQSSSTISDDDDDISLNSLDATISDANTSNNNTDNNDNSTNNNNNNTSISIRDNNNNKGNSLSSTTKKKKKKNGINNNNKSSGSSNGSTNKNNNNNPYCLASGLTDDIRRRLQYYGTDFLDGIFGHHSLYKTISTTIFLYFSVLLPCIAFGVVDTNNTDGIIDPKKTMIGQAVGGLLFALFGGQPLVVVMTTAPLCIYVKVIYQISQDLGEEFLAFYACVGLWMALFLVIFSITNLSDLMSYCTRSTEDIFAIFTALAFGSDGIKEAIRSFHKYYYEPECYTHGTILVSHTLDHSNKNLTATYTSAIVDLEGGQHGAAGLGHELTVNNRCSRESCILFLFLMFGTLWLANSFNHFNQTPYLSTRKREIIKDYALAISVLIFSFIGTYLFVDIKLDVFEFSDFTGLQLAQVHQLSAATIGIASILGFMLAILFYIDQNICGAMVNNAPYKLKKGDYFHLDLLVLAILNAFLSLTGFPWMQGKLPHSHLHSKALADYEERVDEGHVHQVIVNIRETRLTGMLCSLLIGLSLFAVPYPLSYIPIPVLSGVFLYTAMAEFRSNSMIERICLFFTEQAAYPPNHYIRRCPQRKIHFFTIGQLIQLLLVSFIGFYPNPYVNLAFPLVVATFVPFREKILPWFIDTKYLDSLDAHN